MDSSKTKNECVKSDSWLDLSLNCQQSSKNCGDTKERAQDKDKQQQTSVSGNSLDLNDKRVCREKSKRESCCDFSEFKKKTTVDNISGNQLSHIKQLSASKLEFDNNNKVEENTQINLLNKQTDNNSGFGFKFGAKLKRLRKSCRKLVFNYVNNSSKTPIGINCQQDKQQHIADNNFDKTQQSRHVFSEEKLQPRHAQIPSSDEQVARWRNNHKHDDEYIATESSKYAHQKLKLKLKLKSNDDWLAGYSAGRKAQAMFSAR